MKLAAPQPLHLTYCSNVHPGETWAEVFENLQQYVLPLKAQIAPTASFGIGLRLSHQAAEQLLQDNHLAAFHSWLQQHQLYVFTLNGFPYGGFHQQVVKDRVYAPDWTERSRLDYTLNLANILASILPDDIDGGISTVPLSYKPWYPTVMGRETALKQCCIQLAIAVEHLMQIQAITGKIIHLDLEPEPDGLIENTAEVIDFFENWLLPIAGGYLAERLNIPPAAAEIELLTHICLCYDVCHFAVAYESPGFVFRQLQAAGIQIGKIQISAALKVQVPHRADSWDAFQRQLSPFAESTYLHQVVERCPGNQFHHYRDLSDALAQQSPLPGCEWRIHFHVPIFESEYGGSGDRPFQSTQSDILETFQALSYYAHCNHLEIETYTWEVLPTALKTDLLTSLQREYEWAIAHLLKTQPPKIQPSKIQFR
ncbi:MAG: metabolite traffic protein EboE [Oculatellaceae cyanobacterium Prado106]|jgi:hypothetical protein|nr:metabolite traffic protein EboE [Oculatellaceae cyanobacterium Prado106]